MRPQRPALTLPLMLAAAGLMLAGGVWLARRQVEERRPVDRTLLRETASILQEELSRLDAVLTSHLRRAAGLAETGAPLTDIRAVLENLRGPELFTVLPRGNGKPSTISTPSPGSLPPVPELVEGQRRPDSPFALALRADDIFGPAAEGWAGRPGDAWLAWWRRLEGERVAVLLIRGKTVEQTVSAQLENLLTTAWAPVRAAGGLDRVEGGGGGNPRRPLAGIPSPPDRPADFIVPLTSRLGNWQIASWDQRGWRTEFDIPTLAVAGTLAIGIALLGWKVAAAQRAALREVTARVSFVNRVSHELSAPLTNLQLSLDLARDSLDCGNSGETERRLGIAREETARLGRMVANVLTFARRERGQAETVRPESCQPAELVDRVLEQFAPALKRRGIAVTTVLDSSLRADLDTDAFSRIVANLLSNVEKYAAAGERAVISLSAESGALRLSVRDFGPGIPDDQADRIFQPFERLDSRITEGVTGTGLGLAIARDLAERMGGRVVLLPGGPDQPGAAFELTLPLLCLPALSRPANNQQPRSSPP
ncbi:MAG: HAMP domain-containing sensor histidine kinase [Verrucomicrobiota bacterium]